MPQSAPQFSADDVQVVKKATVFSGFFKMVKLHLRHRLFGGGWSAEISREIFARGHACAAVLYDPQRDLIGLIEQFRCGALDSVYGPWCLEVVAGMVEADETPEQVMRRELKEEASIDQAELVFITEYYSTPGGCDEKIYLYCALCDLGQAGGLHGLDEEHEDIQLHTFPAEDVFAAMLKSRMNNAATLIGLQWLHQNRPLLRANSAPD